jgi:A/G-specific adenine glycosylase
VKNRHLWIDLPLSTFFLVAVRNTGVSRNATLRRKLHAWFKSQGRDLPWRRTKDAYAIMVSEFMLQQTTVTSVIPYFERWMKRFPSVADLASADEHTVLSLWQGLGYYSRARNLHRAAKAIMELHGGRVPRSAEALRSLPGVGGYTAAAVAAFAFDAVEPVIDANIARVLARLQDWRKPIDDAAGKAFLEESAREFLPTSGGCLHNSSLMELGALICISRTPRCAICPVKEECLAASPELLPIKRPRKEVTNVTEDRAFIISDGKIWLELSNGPRWRGMWLLPLVDASGRTPDHVEIHPITRFRVTLQLYREKDAKGGLSGFSPEDLPPMPSPHLRAVAAFLGKRHSV